MSSEDPKNVMIIHHCELEQYLRVLLGHNIGDMSAADAAL